MMSKVKLKFHNVGEIVGSDELAIITLADEPQERMITIVCDKAMAVQLELRAKRRHSQGPGWHHDGYPYYRHYRRPIPHFAIQPGDSGDRAYPCQRCRTPICSSTYSYLYGIIVDGPSECSFLWIVPRYFHACEHLEYRDA